MNPSPPLPFPSILFLAHLHVPTISNIHEGTSEPTVSLASVNQEWAWTTYLTTQAFQRLSKKTTVLRHSRLLDINSACKSSCNNVNVIYTPHHQAPPITHCHLMFKTAFECLLSFTCSWKLQKTAEPEGSLASVKQDMSINHSHLSSPLFCAQQCSPLVLSTICLESGKLIVSRYIAESITTDTGRFDYVGLCQQRTKLFGTQLTKAYVAEHPASVVIDSATYQLAISSPNIGNVAMSLYNIILFEIIFSTTMGYCGPHKILLVLHTSGLQLTNMFWIKQNKANDIHHS